MNTDSLRPSLSGKWMTGRTPEVFRRAARTRTLRLREQRQIASAPVDWSAQSEGSIRAEMERRIDIWLTKKLEPRGVRSA